MQNQKPSIKTALAPMAGVTDSAFRIMNMLGGADPVYSEMAHVNALSHGGKKTFNILSADEREREYIVQIFGNDPEYFKRAASAIDKEGVPKKNYKPIKKSVLKIIQKMRSLITGQETEEFIFFMKNFEKFNADAYSEQKINRVKPAVIDINLGCPARKVFFHGSGAALFTDQKKTRLVLESVLEATKIPVSVKIRAAVQEVSMFDFLKNIEDLPLKRIMVHGRSLTQGFAGQIDCPPIKKLVKEYPDREFWINGGINDWKEAQRIVRETGCHNLGLARGTWGDPLLHYKIKNNFREETVNEQVKKIQAGILSLIHTELNIQSKGEKGIFEIRKHLAWYFKDFTGAKDLRKKLVTIKNINELKALLEKEVL